MSKKIYISLICVFISFNWAFAQDNQGKNIPISLSYYGDYYINPGIKAGIGYPLKEIKKQKVKKDSTARIKTRAITISGNLLWYNHKRNINAYAIYPEITFSSTRMKGLESHASIGLGYFRTFLYGTVYEVDENESIHKIKNAGNNRFMISISGGFGYDLRKIGSNLPIAIHFTPSLLLIMPEANGTEIHPTIEIGIRYYLNK